MLKVHFRAGWDTDRSPTEHTRLTVTNAGGTVRTLRAVHTFVSPYGQELAAEEVRKVLEVGESWDIAIYPVAKYDFVRTALFFEP
jgi:hypothetical protein